MKNFICLILLYIFIFSFTAFTVHSQVRDSISIADTTEKRTAWNNVYLEIGGSNVELSLNYEHLFNDNWSVRIGLTPRFRPGALTLLGGSYLIGSGSHKFEIGASGSIFTPPYYDNALLFFSGIIGYRYQPKSGGFFFRAAFTPLVFNSATITQDGRLIFSPIGSPPQYTPYPQDLYTSPILPWIGISLGGTF
jgi:hypothetical protein